MKYSALATVLFCVLIGCGNPGFPGLYKLEEVDASDPSAVLHRTTTYEIKPDGTLHYKQFTKAPDRDYVIEFDKGYSIEDGILTTKSIRPRVLDGEDRTPIRKYKLVENDLIWISQDNEVFANPKRYIRQ